MGTGTPMTESDSRSLPKQCGKNEPLGSYIQSILRNISVSAVFYDVEPCLRTVWWSPVSAFIRAFGNGG